jgi:hypothetical protein
MSELGKNAIRIRRLLSIGATWPELLEEIADLLDSKDSHPHVACFFQLPYPLHLDRDWHRVRGSRGDANLYLHFQPRLAKIAIDEFARPSIKELPANDRADGTTVTQMIALIPLWDPRLRYYPEYLRCVSEEDLAHRIIVPKEYSWLPDGSAISSPGYEHDLVTRTLRLIDSGLRFLLPSYSVSSLVEAQLPPVLNNFFTMPAPGRVIFNRPPVPIWSTLLSELPNGPVTPVTSGKLQKALKGGLRDLGKFEHQLLAMNRLRLDGEKALALIGTLSLLEWFLNAHFPGSSKRQESVRVLISDGRLDFLPEPHRALLNEAGLLRNRLVHGSPPDRYNLASPHDSAGREQEYQGNVISSEKVEHVIRTALEVFRLANLKRQDRL